MITAQKRKKAVFAVINEKKSVSHVAKEAGVARKTVYSWIKRYKKSPSRTKKYAFETKYPRGKDHPAAYSHKLKANLIRELSKNPSLSLNSLSKKLKKGRHAIYNLLKHLELTTRADREAFARLYTGPGRLEIDIKISLVRKVNNKEGSISQLAKENNVSRKTIYKWLSQYNQEGNLSEKYASGLAHPRAYNEYQVSRILSSVVKNPELSIHNLAKKLSLSSHGVYNVLKRMNLTYKEARYAYASSHSETKLASAYSWLTQRLKIVWEQFVPSLLPAPPTENFTQRLSLFFKTFLASTTFTSLFTLALIYWIRILGSASSGNTIGLLFASVALLMGSFFFIYSLKYYISITLVLSFSGQEGKSKRLWSKKGGFLSWLLAGGGNSGRGGNGNGNPVGLEPNLDHVSLAKKPFVSVHIPFFNEKKVVKRSIEAVVSFDYPSYEVILCDDSTDETSDIIRAYQEKYLSSGEKLKTISNTKEGWSLTSIDVRPGVTLKHLHRSSRKGFKGAALGLGLKLSDPRTEFVSVFDADFVPYSDTLSLFLKYFKVQNNMNEDYTKSNVAAVQGYQWHVLNKSENWITRGVRSEYAGSYVIERSGIEIYGGLKQISGSVYMVRKDALKEVGWGSSITEDFELTLKLYNAGYKVVYTPYVQAPAECVSTLKRLIKQRMRWAEGHSNNIKKNFVSLMRGNKLSNSEKFEFLYLSPYYLQAFFFLVGTISWFLAEAVFASRLPFWTELWGWSLVLTNIIALPLLNGIGLFLEESENKDYSGLASFITLSYIVVPFQAYAAVKGFLEKEEGPWFRTPKTGKITDVFARGKFYRFIQGIIPGKAVANNQSLAVNYQYLNLPSANNRFNNFSIKRRKGNRGVAMTVMTVLLIISLTFFSLAPMVSQNNIPVATAFDDGYNKVLLHMNGTDASTTFTDELGKTWTAANNAQIDTAQSKFGGASGLFDGYNDYITTPHHADFDLGSGDFTIDCWVRFNALPANGVLQFITSHYYINPYINGWYFAVRNTSGTYYLAFYGYNTSSIVIAQIRAISLSANTWTHLAVVRSGSSWYLVKDGTQLGTTGTDADAPGNISRVAAVGISAYDLGTGDFNGWIDELRIGKGIARWTANFTPETVEYPENLWFFLFIVPFLPIWLRKKRKNTVKLIAL
ncbi:glycosyltransferase [Patescibacteria group bacterium]